MTADKASRPPMPGSFVQPNFHAIEEAVGRVPFPISKRDLMETVGDATAIVRNQNVALRTVIRDLNDDYFESEDDFHEALELTYGTPAMANREPAAPLPREPPLRVDGPNVIETPDEEPIALLLEDEE